MKYKNTLLLCLVLTTLCLIPYLVFRIHADCYYVNSILDNSWWFSLISFIFFIVKDLLICFFIFTIVRKEKKVSRQTIVNEEYISRQYNLYLRYNKISNLGLLQIILSMVSLLICFIEVKTVENKPIVILITGYDLVLGIILCVVYKILKKKKLAYYYDVKREFDGELKAYIVYGKNSADEEKSDKPSDDKLFFKQTRLNKLVQVIFILFIVIFSILNIISIIYNFMPSYYYEVALIFDSIILIIQQVFIYIVLPLYIYCRINYGNLIRKVNLI